VDAVVVGAPGKVNLGLRVAALRGDGYHELDTLFATIDLADELRVERTAAGVSGEVEVDPQAGAVGEVPPIGPDNLAARAAAAWLRAAALDGGVRIALRKTLPVAAGLGGGSSDAGAVLRAMARLWPADADPVAVAAELGSDVPFFAAGVAAARGRGRGERLTPLELPPRWLVLANPRLPVPVGQAYAALTAFGPPLERSAILDAWRAGGAPPWRNDLQPGVLRRFPEVRAAWRALADAGLDAPLLSGSGATCFALARDEGQARAAAAELAARHPGWWVRAARAPADPSRWAVRAAPAAARGGAAER
jgi:4-diphosphocytidyl-2-C-methyl-D-erythritol kinase